MRKLEDKEFRVRLSIGRRKQLCFLRVEPGAWTRPGPAAGGVFFGFRCLGTMV